MSVNLLSISLRGYGRILTLSLGVILAVSLITGINIGVETVSGSALKGYLNRTPYDMTATQTSDYNAYQNVSSALSLVAGVYHVEPVFEWTPISLFNTSTTFFTLTSKQRSLTPSNATVTALGVSSEFPSNYNASLVAGAWSLTDGIVMSQNTAEILGVNPGDRVNLTLYYPAPSNSSIKSTSLLPPTILSFTQTFTVAGVTLLSPTAQSMVQTSVNYNTELNTAIPLAQTLLSHQLIFSYSGLLSTYNLFTNKSGPPLFPALQILHRIFVRRDKITNLFDPAAMLARTQTVEAELQFSTSNYHLQINSQISGSIINYQTWLSVNLASFYLFSLPVLLVSWYVTMTTWFLLARKRRRTFGLLKVRGISSKGIFRTTMLEAASIGILAGILGILLGFLTGGMVSGVLSGSSLWRFNPQALTPETAILGLMIGLIISVLGAVQPAKRVAQFQPVDAGKDYLAEEAEVSRPLNTRWIWIALLLAVYKMMEWFLGFNPSTILPNGPPSNNFFVSIVFSLWVFTSGVLTFLAPFLFIFAVTSILTRSRFGLYRSAHFILKSFLRELSVVSARTLSKNPARIARATFLIALTLSFGVFAYAMTATSRDLQTRVVELSVGGDINIGAYSPNISSNFSNLSHTSGINETFASKIAAISGVQGVTTIVKAYATTYKDYGSERVLIYGIDLNSFLKVAYATQDLAVGSTSSVAHQMQLIPNATLLSQPLASQFRIHTGDLFELNQTNPPSPRPIILNIAGLYKFLPGTTPAVDVALLEPILSAPILSSIIVDMHTLRTIGPVTIIGYTFLVRTTSSANIGGVVNTIQNQAQGQLLSISTLQAASQRLQTDPSAVAPLAFLQLTALFLFAAAVIGSTLTSWAGARARFGEIAVFRARGASRKQLLRLLSAETLTILTIALIIGIPTGLLESYSVLTFLTSPNSSSAFANLTFTILFPLQLGVLLAAASICLLASSLIPAWMSMRETIIRSLRFR